MTQNAPNRDRDTPRLYLITPVTGEPAPLQAALPQALAAADIAAVLLRLQDADERTLVNRIKAVAPLVQRADAALLVADHARLVARAGADGAHLAGAEDFAEAVSALKPDRIAGAGNLHTRHDAMLVAEAGADYVMFGEPDARGERPSFASILERVGWWAEVFQTPCVAYAAAAEEVGPLAQAGADFVAIGDYAFADADALVPALRAAMLALRMPERVP